jgi:type VI protein secretion system component Hcp
MDVPVGRKDTIMRRGRVAHPRSLGFAGIVMTAVSAAIVIGTANGAQSAAKPKPIGQLVLGGGAPSLITAYSWGVTADSKWTRGSGASIAAPNPGAIRFTKQIDSSSIPTLQRIVSGATFASAVFTASIGKGNSVATIVYEMGDLLVTSVTQGASDGVLVEDVTLVFKTVRWTFTDPSGNVTTGTWDIPSGAFS